MITFLRKIKERMLLKRLHKLSVSAFSLNRSIQKSKLPPEVKMNSSELVSYYSNLLIKFNSITGE